ncbi:mechanosensitive ion channel family protein [Acidovorax sp. 1608163]|uniref:mechanosensitive ion channel family protein n=1 Tax=Acidovorax sp. 1608163 TaxID=2478662 RepID=UPI000EF7452A|nr:mechanosensitive ion channel family protein [Acidovorax sp. 1608163]AYM97400.1 mechanosensitive ion channel family protein [Acidovorax sp. 1608163]
MAIPKHRLPEWVQDWLEVIVPGGQILGIMLVAFLLQGLLRRLVRKAARHYQLPGELVVPINGLIRWTIMASAVLLVLERLGVSATVLWTAFTGFATVGAVAFFAAWSVLSNLFCALLIFTVRPFRIGDHVEVLDTAEKPGAKGRVVDVNLLYTTLEEFNTPPGSAWVQIPNALIFQRVVRRWHGEPPSPAALAPAMPATGAEPQAASPTASPVAQATVPAP